MRDHRGNEKRQDALIALARARAADGGFTPPAGAEGDLLVFHSGQWQSVIAPTAAGNVLTSAGVATVAAFRPLPAPARQAVPYTDIWFDPSDSTGTASDANPLPGTALLPLLTTAKVNTLLYQGQLTVGDLTIHEMSPDPGAVGLDLGTLSQGSFNLFVAGTPQVLHVGGTLDVGTVAIDPSAGGGGQRQTLHATDVADWGPFVYSGQGGASSFPAYLLDTTAPRVNHFAWIVAGVGSATASASRPTDAAVSAPGPLNIGDGYRIATGSRLNLSSINAPSSDGGLVFFSDIAFDTSNLGNIQGLGFAIYTRCSFNASTLSPGVYNSCFMTSGIIQSGATEGLRFAAGVLVTTFNDLSLSLVEFSSDVYLTGIGLLISPDTYASPFVSPGFGAGLQIQDIGVSGLTGAVTVFEIAGVGVSAIGGDALVWGNGNVGYGMALLPGAVATVPGTSDPTNTPSVTGTLGDFAFFTQGGAGSTFTTVARAWNNPTGAYTEAGGVATRATTWANLLAAIGAGGFFNQAHCVETHAAVIGL